MDLILFLIIIIVPLVADIFVRINYGVYSKKINKCGLNGGDVARKILAKAE